MYLLDTDTLSLHMRGQAKVWERFQRKVEVEPVATSIVSRIEVLTGRFEFVLKASSKVELLRAQTLLFEWETKLTGFQVISFDDLALDEFERIRKIKSLRKIGRADLLIACIALAHKATLVTRNLRDFKLVPGLKIENWAD